MRFEITDAYAHCGLRKYHPLEDVRRTMEAHGVARAVLVQHLGEFDNSYIGAIVAREPRRFAGVFLVDMESPGALDEIARQAERFRGIRLPARSLVSHRAVWERAARLGLNFIIYDSPLVAYAGLLGEFAQAHPGNALVLAHLGLPIRAEAPHFASHRPILELSAHKNILVQISGMHSLSRPPYTNLTPLVSRLHEAFGDRRLLYGSNYPVMKEESIYAAEIELIRSGRLGIPRSAAARVMNDNALRVWFGAR